MNSQFASSEEGSSTLITRVSLDFVMDTLHMACDIGLIIRLVRASLTFEFLGHFAIILKDDNELLAKTIELLDQPALLLAFHQISADISATCSCCDNFHICSVSPTKLV